MNVTIEYGIVGIPEHHIKITHQLPPQYAAYRCDFADGVLVTSPAIDIIYHTTNANGCSMSNNIFDAASTPEEDIFALGAIGGAILYFTKKWYLFTSDQFRQALLIALLFWIVNLFFSVFASPIVLRYQLFNMALAFTFAMPLVDFFLRTETPPADPEEPGIPPEKTALQPL